MFGYSKTGRENLGRLGGRQQKLLSCLKMQAYTIRKLLYFDLYFTFTSTSIYAAIAIFACLEFLQLCKQLQSRYPNSNAIQVSRCPLECFSLSHSSHNSPFIFKTHEKSLIFIQYSDIKQKLTAAAWKIVKGNLKLRYVSLLP